MDPMEEESSVPMGYFDAHADEPIEEHEKNTRLGWTRSEWLNDQRTKKALLDDKHDHKPVGRMVRTYIDRSRDLPHRDMLAFRGGVYLNTPRRRELYESIRRGEIDGVSVEYTTDVDSNGLITGKRLDFIGIVPNPKNPRCRITARQGDGSPSQITFSLPLRSIVAVDSGGAGAMPDTTKTLLRFPPISSSSSSSPFPNGPRSPRSSDPHYNNTSLECRAAPSRTASPSSLSMQQVQAPPQQQSAGVPSSGGSPSVTSQQQQPPPQQSLIPKGEAPASAMQQQQAGSGSKVDQTAMDIVSDVKMQTSKVAEMSMDELRRMALEKFELERVMNSERMRLAEYEKREEERRALETKEKKEKLFAYKELFGDFGINSEDPSEQATMDYIVADENAKTVYNHYTNGMKSLQAERQKTATLLKENAELKMANEELGKKIKSSGPMFGSSPKFPSSAADPNIAARIEADSRSAQANTGGSGYLHPATGKLSFPKAMQSGRTLTMINSGAPTKPAGLTASTTPIVVAQGSDSGTPSTGDLASLALEQDEKVRRALELASDPRFIRTASGAVVDVTKMYKNQRQDCVYDTDRVALYNAFLNRGIGSSLRTENYAQNPNEPVRSGGKRELPL